MNQKIIKYISVGVFALVLLILFIGMVKAWVISGLDIDDKIVAGEALKEKLITADQLSQALEKTNFDSARTAPLFEPMVRDRRAGHAFNNIAVPLSVALTVLVGLIAVGLAAFKLAQNKERLIRFAIPVVALIVIVLIARATAGTDIAGVKIDPNLRGEAKDAFISNMQADMKTVGTVVNTTLILLFASLAALVGAFTYNKVRK